MKKRLGLIFSIVVAVLVLLFIGLSAFIGLQVFAGSTQLVTNEKTRAVPAGFWEKYGLDYESFRRQYQVEEIEIPSSFGGHKIPADYIYAVESGNSKNHPSDYDSRQEATGIPITRSPNIFWEKGTMSYL